MIDLSNIPFDVSQILFRDERTFRANEQLYLESNNLSDLADGISAITKISSDDLLNGMPFTVDEKVPDDFVFTDKSEVSFLRIWQHLNNILTEYEPNGDISADFFAIAYKGEVFKINNKSFRASIYGDVHMTAGEAIEVMELQKGYADAVSKSLDETDEKMRELGFEEEVGKAATGSFLASMDWKIGRREAAILLKRVDEVLPWSAPEREAWLKDREAFWSDINLKDMIDLRFFLTSTLVDSIDLRSIMDTGMVGHSSKKKVDSLLMVKLNPT